MHYQVRIQTPGQAVAETKKWFGSDNFKSIEDKVFHPIFRSSASRSHKLRLLYLSMEFGGVRGRGVIHGLYRYYSNPQPSITHSRTVIEVQAKVVA